MKSKKIIMIVILVLLILLGVYVAYGYYEKLTYKPQKPIVSMEIENFGTVKIELYPEVAPNTVRNFIKLINEGYYNGLTFHRVEDTLIQGGDINGDGTGETEYTIAGEFKINGYKNNNLSFERGTLGLARQDYTIYYYYTGDSSYLTAGYNSGCAQFFITAEDCSENFDGSYCAFGKVIEGLEIIDKIKVIETKTETNEETGEVSKTTTPVNSPIIKNMTVDTFGVEYNKPEIIKVN